VAGWAWESGAVSLTQVASRAHGWSRPVNLAEGGSAPNQLSIDDVQVAVDAAGNALALWGEVTQGRQAIVVTDERPAAGGKWQPSLQVSRRPCSPRRRR
jgi:hypothetical protein